MVYIFLQERYDPEPDPNSICTQQLVFNLALLKKECYIICDGVCGLENSYNNDEHIIHVPTKHHNLFSKAAVGEKIQIILSRLSILPIWPIRFPQKVKNNIKFIESLIKEKRLPLDEITFISVYRSSEMVEIGYRIKKKYPMCKWIIYNLDGLDSNVKFKFKKWFQYKETCWQICKYKLADKIFQMQAHKELYINSTFKKFIDKTVFTDYPLLVKNNNENMSGKKNIECLYCGSFYKNLREPFYMLEWFDVLSHDMRIYLNIYTRNDFVEYIDNKVKIFNGLLKRFDYVSADEMNRIIMQNTLLISIGNTDSPMIPSKLFVYMSSCKPIIHFYYNNKDSCLPYLEKYPYSLLLNMNDSMDTNLNKTKLFINNLYFLSEYDYHEVFEMLAQRLLRCTPLYTVKKIIEI